MFQRCAASVRILPQKMTVRDGMLLAGDFNVATKSDYVKRSEWARATCICKFDEKKQPLLQKYTMTPGCTCTQDCFVCETPVQFVRTSELVFDSIDEDTQV